MKKCISKILRITYKVAFINRLRCFILRRLGATIGSNVYIGDYFCIISELGNEKSLLIEDFASIGPNVTIILESHPNSSKLSKHKDKYPFLYQKGEVKIYNNAWIGAGVIIMPNVDIGEYCIIGAGSVVTRSIPPFSVAVGNPAKVIRKLELLDT